MTYSPQMKNERLRLRTVHNFTYNQICAATGVSKSAISLWLRDRPLSPEEKAKKMKRPGLRKKKDRGEDSCLYKSANTSGLTRFNKSKIAESAALLRLAIHGFNVFGSVFDGEKADWVVEVPETNRIHKIQVKWAKEGRVGLPIISLVCTDGHARRRRYREGEFDFIVGYCLRTDTAYVWSWNDVKNNETTITVSDDAKERWDKLRA